MSDRRNQLKAKGTLGQLSRFATVLHAKAPTAIMTLFVATVMASVLSVGVNQVIRLIVDALSARRDVPVFIVLVILVTVGRFGQSRIMEFLDYKTSKVSETVSHMLQQDILSHIETIEFSCLENAESRDLIERVRENAKKESAELLVSVSQFGYSLLVVALLSVLLSSILWYTSLILIVSSVGSMYLSTKFGLDVYMLRRRQSRAERLSRYYESLLLERRAAKEIRLFDLLGILSTRWSEQRKEIANEEFRQLGKHTILEFSGKAIQATGFFLCLFLSALALVHDGAVSIGDFVFVMNIGALFFDDMTRAQSQIEKISRTRGFVDDALQFQNLPSEPEDKQRLGDAKLSRIVFESVSFAYPGRHTPALVDIDVTLMRGQTIVCVGENGSGKTTFLNLLLGLYLPTTGRITVDGNDIHYVRQQMRDHCACVTQNYTKYQLTIEEILRFSRDIGNGAIRGVISKLLPFVDSLPSGAHTPLGQLWPGSIELSEGQWQRLAIAKAILKPNTDLLVLDEFTSALDPVAESQIYEDIKSSLEDRTTIIVSHRLGVCTLADTILVFDRGRIVERGSHRELLAMSGLYSRMYNSQASWLQKGR